jgi:Pregnancy-associated plasma protein-A/Secretion system C-terminal sorting domain
MRKLFTSLAFFMLTLSATAQVQEQCATMAVLKQQQQDPTSASRYAAAQQAAAAWRATMPSQRTTGAPILTIPVVVHVLYKNVDQNISNAQIYSQIDILNADYRRLNADTLNTPAMFDSIAADIEVEFCLASLDPSGAPTSGITRTSTSGGQLFGYFSPFFEDAKYDSLGGHDAWPADRYLNIWVCEAFPGLLGYAQFPGGDAATDGVVISYQAFGDMGTVTAPSTLGRTTSHEVGHWMGLYHIWGDDQDCTGSDSIFDTPNATVASSSDCEVSRNSCSNEDSYWGAFDPNDMVQNYMDYSHDSCMNMFSLGQKARMHSFLNTDPMRMALFNSPAGCNLVGIPALPSRDHDFDIYPNPTDGVVRVNYLGASRPEMIVEVFDFAGRVMYRYAATDYSYTLNLSQLAAGVYTLKIVGESGVTARKLVLE